LFKVTLNNGDSRLYDLLKKEKKRALLKIAKSVPVLYLSMLSKRLGHDIKKEKKRKEKERKRGKSEMREGEK
jgi:hypothetical protein